MRPQLLRRAAGLLAVGVAVIHLFHPRLGFPRLVMHLQLGTLFDPRPLLFTVVGFAILAGTLLAYNGVLVRPIYLAGIGTMVVLLVGYVAWHTVLDHGAFWPHIPAGHSHDDAGVVYVVLTHLAADSIALVSKLLEFALLVVLGVLYLEER